MMRFSLSKTHVTLALVLAGSLLGGCSSSTRATRFYVLNPLDPGPALVSGTDHSEALSVEVAALHLPQYLERPQIVTRSSENRLELAEFHQWGGNLRKNMMRVLAKNLSQLLDTPHIAISPYRPRVSPHFRVELEVMRFERDPDGQVRLSTQWRLSDGRDGRSLITQMTDLVSPKIARGSDMGETVSAMSGLVGELSRIIGQAVLRAFRGRSGS
jgi:uncharacterized lipoprotein YmbA